MRGAAAESQDPPPLQPPNLHISQPPRIHSTPKLDTLPLRHLLIALPLPVGLGTPTLNLRLIYLTFLVIILIYFLWVSVFLAGQHLGFSHLDVNRSLVGSFRAFLGRYGGFISILLLGVSSLSITLPAKSFWDQSFCRENLRNEQHQRLEPGDIFCLFICLQRNLVLGLLAYFRLLDAVCQNG